MGIPNRWMVYFMENPNLKWMMISRDSPVPDNLHISGVDNYNIMNV